MDSPKDYLLVKYPLYVPLSSFGWLELNFGTSVSKCISKCIINYCLFDFVKRTPSYNRKLHINLCLFLFLFFLRACIAGNKLSYLILYYI